MQSFCENYVNGCEHYQAGRNHLSAVQVCVQSHTCLGLINGFYMNSESSSQRMVFCSISVLIFCMALDHSISC